MMDEDCGASCGKDCDEELDAAELYTLVHVASQLSYRYFQHPREYRSLMGRSSDHNHEHDRTRGWERQTAKLLKRMEARPEFNVEHAAIARCAAKLPTAITQHLFQLRAQGGFHLPFSHPRYPASLREIDDPPYALSALGTLSLTAQPAVAVIGSRRSSAHALRISRQIGTRLAQLGFVVVSGGAFGCDIESHIGVLEAKLEPTPAILVFAGGLAEWHPQLNAGTFRRLRDSGALFLSERLWDAKPLPYDFPVRNRILAGVALSLLLAEANDRSGAMITAVKALDQGKEILVAQPVSENFGSGNRRLIEEGAWTFGSAQEASSRIVESLYFGGRYA